MANLQEIMNKISLLEDISDDLLNVCRNMFEKLNKCHPDLLDILKIDNIYKSLYDEVSVEWFFLGEYYIFLRIRAKECRVEGKIPEGRVAKCHPICYKVVSALAEWINKAKEEKING